MDPKDKEIADLKAQLAEKERVIAEKNNDIVGLRKQYEGKFRKLSEMTDEEKARLSDAELEMKRQQEALAAKQEELEQQQRDFMQKQKESILNDEIRRLVGNDEKAAEKLKYHFGRLKGADEALTKEDITPLMQDAFNLLGDEKPDPIRNAANFNGGDSPNGGDGSSFADTPEGKSLAETLNLGIEEPKPATPPTPNTPDPLAAALNL